MLYCFPKHLQPRAIVLWGVGVVFSPVVGPIVDSLMAEIYDWRAAVCIIVPAGIVTLICTLSALSGPVHREKIRFDWPGFIVLSIAIIAL